MNNDNSSYAFLGNRLAHFEDCRSAIDQLFFDAVLTEGCAAFDQFLDFAAQLSNLSIYNAMLVRVQRPGAGAVATRRKWLEFGRMIKPDAIPIVVLQPFGPVSFLFEQEDTYGQPLPSAEHNPLLAKGQMSLNTYKKTCMAAEKYMVEIVETNRYGALLAGTAAGFAVVPESFEVIEIDEAKNRQRRIRAYRIKLNANYDLATRYATLAHELGHIYCGHVGADSSGRWPDRHGLNQAQKEVEAEAVAWLVCQRNGVETRSREYLNEYLNIADLSGISMYAIFEAANRVESRSSVGLK